MLGGSDQFDLLYSVIEIPCLFMYNLYVLLSAKIVYYLYVVETSWYLFLSIDKKNIKSWSQLQLSTIYLSFFLLLLPFIKPFNLDFGHNLRLGTVDLKSIITVT